MSPYGSGTDPCNGVTSVCEGPFGGMFDSLHVDFHNGKAWTEDATPFATVVGVAAVGLASWAVAGLIVGGGEVAVPAAAAAARGFQSSSGGTFDSVQNAAGGTVWTSTGLINQNDVSRIVNSALYTGQQIAILTGVHGGPDGEVEEEGQFLKDDINRFSKLPGVSVLDYLTTPAAQISSLLNSSGITIGAFCNSGVCLQGK